MKNQEILVISSYTQGYTQYPQKIYNLNNFLISIKTAENIGDIMKAKTIKGWYINRQFCKKNTDNL